MVSNLPILLLFSTSFFFLLDHLVSPLSQTCYDQRCNPGEPGIRFPFRLKQFQPEERCVYPGFDLSCNAQSQTILSLPSSGEFVVRFIDYVRQVIWLGDPDGCLPRRLQTFTPSGSNWTVQHYTSFTYFNCTRISVWYPSTSVRVPCLDGHNYYVVVVATDDLSYVRNILSELGCGDDWTIKIPTADSAYTPSDDVEAYSNTFGLTWAEPSCGKCEAQGGTCRLKREEGLKIDCIGSYSHNKATPHWWIFVGIAIPCIMFFASLLSHISSKLKARAHDQQDQTSPSSLTGRARALVTSGMDTPAIELYPKTQIGNDGGLMPQDNTCSICLSEYKLKEVLRTIPECKHSFHAHCIDPWLKRMASCPLCRSQQG